MRGTYYFILILLIRLSIARIVLAQVPFEDYHCGTDVTSRFSSYLMTSQCDQAGINVCCAHHDQCYSACAVPQLTCDIEFCECLFALDANLYCRNFVHASHCNTVQWLGHNYICPPMAQPLIG
ncbi:hypothetical protein Y032_0419g1129 [Ancylostoma ceylanicum]|uniref:Phospholipase A2 n=1 Tax=Ancylostoma ceylanicum TaxID=53326 RepID=A0A016X1I6_9BILA|nr:hypothetical protein Y032_0419g1129 [Ancylostoma ceylanicum]